MARLIALLLLLIIASGTALAADSARTQQVRVSLLSEGAAAVPGETLWLGLRFEMIPHWHVYWRNPGDSGEAPRVDWELPDGWQAGDIRWPTPQRIPVGPLVNYGYEDSVTLLVPIDVPQDQPVGTPVDIVADVSWLVCREECLPQDARLQLSLPVMQLSTGPAANRTFGKLRAKWPVAMQGNAGYARQDGVLTLHIDASDRAGALSKFFPQMMTDCYQPLLM